MTLGAIRFFSSFVYFFGGSTDSIEYKNFDYMLRLLCISSFALFGLYFGLYFFSGKKLAIQLGGGMALLLLVAYLIGSLLH